PPARLMESLSEALAGGAPMTPQIARRVIEHFQSPRQLPSSSVNDLTPHENRILRLLVEGHHYQTATDELGVTSIRSASIYAASTKSCKFIRRRRPWPKRCATVSCADRGSSPHSYPNMR